MINLYDAVTAELVKERIGRLGPQSERQWGSMTAPQMLEHCSRSMEWALNERIPDRAYLIRIVGMLVKPMVFKDDAPFRKNSPTAKSLIVSEERDLTTEQARLTGLIDRFVANGPARCTRNPHSFFGRLTPDEWAVLMYKHVDHHLRQFGA